MPVDPLFPLEDLARARGWGYRRTMLPHRDTPFLHLGDDAEAGPCFAFTILGRLAELYEHRRVTVEGAEHVVRGSYVVLRLVDAVHLAEIDQIRLLPRSTALGVAAPLNDRRVVELESLELSQVFLLEAGRETSEVALRKLFTPALISALLDLARGDTYLGEYLDYAHGRIVLASGGTLTSSDGPVVEATMRAAEPVLREVLYAAGA